VPAEAPAGGRTRRRYDPERRERIVEACLDVVADVGVAGASHRRVAAAADVPLGSTTYHFDGMADLLHAAFTRFAADVAARTSRRLDGVGDRATLEDALVDVVTHHVLGSRRDLVLTQELYTLAARDERFREITHGWMAASRAALERHVDPATARVLDALVEGLTLHRALDTEPHDPAVVVDAVRRVLAGGAPPSAHAS